MKAVVVDDDALASLRPIDMASYLRANGWRLLDVDGNSPVSAWSKEGARGYFETEVPKHQHWRDYPKRVYELLAVLAEDEGRSPLDLFKDVSFSTRDVVRVRCVVDGRSDGSMPLVDAAIMASASRNLMLAAACSTVEPRRAYHTRKPSVATDYLSQLSMGQTEHGSYVLTLFASVPPSLQSQVPFGFASQEKFDDDPFSRRVTKVLDAALESVSDAADVSMSTGELAAFEGAVDKGVSADLCEALALVGTCASVARVAIRIGWASARNHPGGSRPEHEFARDSLEVIREAGRMLRERTPEDDFELEGFVVDLDRPEQALFGRAVVAGAVGAQTRKIRLEVTGEAWNQANEAMSTRARVRCRGELVRDGRQYVLRNPRDFRLALTDD